MKPDYRIEALAQQKALSAFALLHAVEPSFPVEDWDALAAPGSRWTCVVAQDRQGYVRGLAVYRMRKHPVAGDLMDVPIFIAASVVDDAGIAEQAFEWLRNRASRCNYIRVWSAIPKALAYMQDEATFTRWDHGLIYRVHSKAPPALL